MLEFGFQVTSVIAAGVAAWLWFQSTKIATPTSLGVSTIVDDIEPYADNSIKRWANQISEKNRHAAFATALSVAAQGMATLSSIVT